MNDYSTSCFAPLFSAAACLRGLLFMACLATSSLLTAQDLTVTLNDVTTCQGEAVVLSPDVSGGDPPYNYAWSPAAGLSCTDCATPTALPATTTTYSVTVTNATGSGTATATVEVIVTPPTDLVVAICPGEVYNIAGDQLTTSGQYTYVLVSSLGCDSIITLDLTVNPEVFTELDVLACDGESVTVGNETYNEPGTYTQVLVANNGCDSVLIVNVLLSAPMMIAADITEVNCQDSDGQITVIVSGGTPPYVYIWSTGNTTPSHTNLPPGLYCVTVVDAVGCAQEECFTLVGSADFSLDIEVDGELSCGDQPVTLTAQAMGGTPPFTYSWQINGVPFSTDISISGVFPNDNIALIATSADGCELIITTTLAAPTSTPNLQPTYLLDCNTSEVTLDGTASEPSPDLTYVWTGPDGAVANTAIVSVNQAGIYTLVITDNALVDCTTTTTVEVQSFFDLYSIPPTVETTACNTFELTVAVPVPPGFVANWLYPSGQTAVGSSIETTETGVHQLIISDISGSCQVATATYIDAGADFCATLTGRLVQDDNEDCLADSTEPGTGEWLLSAVSATDTFYTYADTDGQYDFYLPLGTYVVTAYPPSGAWEPCADDYPVVLANEGETVMQDMPFGRLVNCPELSIDISTNLLRRCFNSFYTLQICNDGTIEATAPVVTVELDPFINFINTNHAVTVDGQTLTYALAPLAPGQCKTIVIQVEVDCSAVLGQTHCTTATVTPDELCSPIDPLWSGASLVVAGTCTGDEVQFVISNDGDGDLADPVHYIVIEDGVMLMQAPSQINSLLSQADTTLSFPANGSTYTVVLDQAMAHPFSTQLTTFVEGCTTGGSTDFSTGFAALFGVTTSGIATDVDCTENVGSYDPNDKLASPKGYGEQNYIFPEQVIDYKIRFQNTGTDTAFTVVIRDSLSDWLDMTTLRPGPSSHPYRIDIQDQRTLVFTFDNIMLPDSNVNEPASNGYVTYQIAPARDIPLETRIYNRAGIYFDFNEPVITPTIFHTVGEDFLEVSNSTVTLHRSPLDLSIYPNPTNGVIQLTLRNAPNGDRQLRWFDSRGRLLGQEVFTGDTFAPRVPATQPGVYWFSLLINGEPVGTGKVVLE